MIGAAGSLLLWPAAVSAEAAEGAEPEQSTGPIEEMVVTGQLRSQPGENVESVLGFQKSLLELPRSASTVSSEQIERFNVKDIDELIVLAPGSFTQSFFGVAGALDVRGTPGETYFRGIRRLDNPGNYPTPIGAADRIDIVRGPASPIMGPSKIGGFLNFEPKSARADGGQYLAENTGEFSYTAGSWDKSVLTAEVGGPGRIGGRDFGFYLYGELEDSGSYYDNTSTDQTLIQASFDMDLTDRLRLQWGGMYHDYEGNQVAGWNRLTQELIDDGIYVTGSPLPLDTDGDGAISHQEYDVNGDGFSDLNPFRFDFLGDVPGGALIPGSDETLAELEVLVGDLSLLALQNPGTARIDGSDVLVAPDDTLENEALVLYFDVIYDFDNGMSLKNQLYYEAYDNLSESAYGFSQFHDTWVVEDKLVLSGQFGSDGLTTSWQLSPSIRYTDFDHADDYTNEYFDRRDLTGPSTALDRRLLATRIDDDYTEYYIGDYLDLGIAALVDFDWDFGLNITAGIRYDVIDIESRQPVDKLLFASSNNFCPVPGCELAEAEDDFEGTSWMLSIGYQFPFGLRPYFTASEQATLIAGQGAEVTTANIASGGAFDTSELIEGGVKGSFLDNRLYFALSAYKQERTDFSAQSIVTNQSTETEGYEFETRWQATDRLLLTAGWSHIEVVNLNTLETGFRFSFIGSDDLPNIEPWRLYGGTLGGNVFRPGESGARRAGMPEDIFTLTGTYDFSDRFAGHFSLVNAEKVASSFSGSVELPGYTLLNVGAVYYTDRWQFSANIKNLTDEEYFRANFPNLFGGTIVLPELPRHYTATVKYLF
ncbi:MAG: TonB-dependent receptor [Gammaproteobacteria bacterium]|nr:TonB-dependent receptor [Gammaproteobacteria bacterium]